MKLSMLALFALAAVVFGGPVNAQQTLVQSFESQTDMQAVQAYNSAPAQSAKYTTQGTRSLQVMFLPGPCSKVSVMAPASSPWDWSATSGMAVDVTNPGDLPVQFVLRAEDAVISSSTPSDYRSGTCMIQPHQTATYVLPYEDSVAPAVYGIRDLPYTGMISAESITGLNPFDPAHIVDFQFIVQSASTASSLYFDNVRTVGAPSMAGIVDSYGQFTGTTWPGKVAQDSDLTNEIATEQSDIAANPAPASYDSEGGWANGPTLAATGWYRTAQWGNKWWLVTPHGHLFFALGMDAVNFNSPTYTTNRTSMFDYLPTGADPLSRLYSTASGTIFGPDTSGTTFDFRAANLQRKYGTNYANIASANAPARLKSWGFNLIGNSSCASTYGQGVPELTRIDVSGSFDTVPVTATGGSVGAVVPDPWDPRYDTALKASIASIVPSVVNDPELVGYYVDNEMQWLGDGPLGRYALGLTALSLSSTASPAKQFFLNQLQAKYGTITAFNTAWGTNLASWAAAGSGFTVPSAAGSSQSLSAQAKSDICNFDLSLAKEYFYLVSSELKKQDPNHLYLGCKFSSALYTPEALQGCALYADVVSMNIYEPRLNAAEWSTFGSLNKPVMVGEFDMGAIDRGVYSPGIVAAANQANRAAMFQDYVCSALSQGPFVGVNWFEYADQPITGRALDGQDANLGFVSIADVPYPEMVAASRSLGQNLYAFRSNATSLATSPVTAAAGSSITLWSTLKRVDTGAVLQGRTITFSVGGTVVGTATTDKLGVAHLSYAVPAGTPAAPETTDAAFAGDANDSYSTGVGTLTVTSIPTGIAVSTVSGTIGTSVNLSATLTRSNAQPLANQTLTFSINGIQYGSATTNASGIATIAYTIPWNGTPGAKTLGVTYGGDDADLAATGTGTLSIVASSTAISIANVTGPAGSQVVIQATLTRTDTNAVLQGDLLSLSIGGQTVTSATTCSTGIAYLAYTIPASAASGNLPVTVSFAGSADFAPSTGSGKVVVPELTTSLLTASVTAAGGVALDLTATLTSSSIALPNRTLSFSLDGTVVGTAATHSTGIAYCGYTLPLTIAAGSHTITVSFAGDSSDTSSSTTATLNVPLITTAISVPSATVAAGSTVAIDPTLVGGSPSAPLLGKTVSLTVNGVSCGTLVTHSNGIAYFNYTVPANAAAGSENIVASFAGDSEDTASTFTSTLTVPAIPTAITVPNVTVTHGSAAPLTATLTRTDTGAVMAGQTLTFTVNGVMVGTATTHSNGIAYFTSYTPSSAGSSPVTVTFTGTGPTNSATGAGTLTVN